MRYNLQTLSKYATKYILQIFDIGHVDMQGMD